LSFFLVLPFIELFHSHDSTLEFWQSHLDLLVLIFLDFFLFIDFFFQSLPSTFWLLGIDNCYYFLNFFFFFKTLGLQQKSCHLSSVILISINPRVRAISKRFNCFIFYYLCKIDELQNSTPSSEMVCWLFRLKLIWFFRFFPFLVECALIDGS